MKRMFEGTMAILLAIATLWLMSDLYRQRIEGRKAEKAGVVQLEGKTEQTQQGPKIHEVAKGNTLFSIAQRYAVSVEALKKANGFSRHRDTLYPRQLLVIPKTKYVDEQVLASWYGPGFHGRKMANGKRFDQNDPTVAAHKTLPLGTKLRVTSKDTGKSIVVEVQDRCPYIWGRELDLSMAAMRRIEPLQKGVVEVQIETIYPRG